MPLLQQSAKYSSRQNFRLYGRLKFCRTKNSQILDSHQFCSFLYYGHLYPVVLPPQRSHDEAITSRTNLRLKVEEEEMQQELVELKLKRDHARAKLGGCVVM